MDDAGHELKPLLTVEGWELLNSLPPYQEEDAFTLNTRLREQGHPPEAVAAALTQSRLRQEAQQKFGAFASRMIFTEDGLQQSTRLPVAARHAQRFREASVTHVADLGCGLGGDAMTMASLDLKVVAVEADEATAAAATMNLLPFPEADVLHTRAEDFMRDHRPLPEGWGLWLDPARRDPAGARGADGAAARIWDPEAFSPPLSFVTELAATGLPMGVKLGPGLPHELIPESCEAEWVSIDGSVVELVLWFNAAARPGVRRCATVLRTAGRETRAPEAAAPEPTEAAEAENAGPETTERDSRQRNGETAGGGADNLRAAELTSSRDFGTHPESQSPGTGVPVRGRAGLTGILWEPDGAVIRAGLVTDLASALGGHLLDEHIAYFCTDQTNGTGSPMARGFRILEVLDFNMKRLRRWAQAEGVASLEIKKRGVDVAPETLRKQLLGGAKRAAQKKPRSGAGQEAAERTSRARTLVLIRIGEERVAAVVEPLSRPA